ncbi:hypothetical protein [Stenotrophomonas maltophilia]|uniref:hypothetical protein n=1 Tax=Stenotrophomonas maltophilia TaxID=40324 RepID=UPI0039F7182D
MALRQARSAAAALDTSIGGELAGCQCNIYELQFNALGFCKKLHISLTAGRLQLLAWRAIQRGVFIPSTRTG